MRLLPPNMKLLIIGTGYLEFSLKLKVQNEKLESQVKFLGFIGHDKLPPYLWASDIFVRPSLSEGMGNSFIEAMAAGLPVVATPVGGIPDFLFAPDPKEIITLVPQVETFSRSQECRNVWRDKITGLFCEPDNPKSIAGALRLLIADSALRGEIIQNASKMVAEKYDWGRVVRQMRQFFT